MILMLCQLQLHLNSFFFLSFLHIKLQLYFYFQLIPIYHLLLYLIKDSFDRRIKLNIDLVD